MEIAIFKPVQNLSSTLQILLRPSFSGASKVSEHQRSESDSRRFKRLQDSREFSPNGEIAGLNSNAHVIKAEGSFDEERDSMLLAGINVRQDVDIERNAARD